MDKKLLRNPRHSKNPLGKLSLKYLQSIQKQHYINKFDFLFRKKRRNNVKQAIKNKNSKRKYKNCKMIKKLVLHKNNSENANLTVVKKYTFNLSNNHKVLLMHDVIFPTPKWNNNSKDNEWFRDS